MVKQPLIRLVVYLLLAKVAGYNYICPHRGHWDIRGADLCNRTDEYVCLYDDVIDDYGESCIGPRLDREGHRQVLNSGNFDRKTCSKNYFQPFMFTAFGNSHCVFKKSLCEEEGQVLVDNGTSTQDRRCGCDFTRGYAFLSKTAHPCYCIPFFEDCCCYIKQCKSEEILTQDYNCVEKTKYASYNFTCAYMPQPKGIVPVVPTSLSEYKYIVGNRSSLTLWLGLVMLVFLSAWFLVLTKTRQIENFLQRYNGIRKPSPTGSPSKSMQNDNSVRDVRDGSKIYEMSTTPRGHVLLISNDFLCKPGENNALHIKGAKKDQKTLMRLFNELGFKMDIKNNKSAKEMEALLKDFSKSNDLLDVDSLIIILMSLGNHDCVLGTDYQSINVINLIESFNKDGCPYMEGKPKMVIVNACTRDAGSNVMTTLSAVPTLQYIKPNFKVEKPILVRSENTKIIEADGATMHKKPASNSDVVLVYSTHSDPHHGSRFVQCLEKVFSETAHQEHVLDMLTQVTDKVIEGNVIGSEEVHITTLHTLRRKWYMKPTRS